MFIQDSRRSYRTYPYSELILITDLCLFGTPVGVTELILIQNLYLIYRYGRTCGYYRDLSDTGVPIGITEQIQRYIQILTLIHFFILIHYSESYHITVGLPRPVIRNE